MSRPYSEHSVRFAYLCGILFGLVAARFDASWFPFAIVGALIVGVFVTAAVAPRTSGEDATR